MDLVKEKYTQKTQIKISWL